MERMKNQRHVKLSEDLRADIMNAKGQMSRIEAAAKFGVSSETVRRIWKSISTTPGNQKVPEEFRERHARFNDLEKQGVVRAFQSGKTVAEIALMYSASEHTINNIIRKETGVARCVRLSDKKKKDICRYYRLGWTLERIASELGISSGTVSYYISKQGLANRNAKRENPELKMAPVRLDGTRDYVRKFIRPEPIKKEDDPMDIETKLSGMTMLEQTEALAIDKLKSKYGFRKEITLNGTYFVYHIDSDTVWLDVKDTIGNTQDQLDRDVFMGLATEMAEIAAILKSGEI